MAVILASAAIFLVLELLQRILKILILKTKNDESIVSTSDKNKPSDASGIYVSEITDNEKKIYSGSLIVVNDKKQNIRAMRMIFVSIYDVREKANADYYTVLDKDVKVRKRSGRSP